MKTMDEMYGGDFPVRFSVVKKYLNTEMLIQENSAIKTKSLSNTDKETKPEAKNSELTKPTEKTTREEHIEETTENTIEEANEGTFPATLPSVEPTELINVTPKKFSLRGFRK